MIAKSADDVKGRARFPRRRSASAVTASAGVRGQCSLQRTSLQGFTHTVKVERVVKGKKVTLKVSEYYPPDTNAAFKILQAYDKKQAFREKTEVQSTFSWAEFVRQTDAYLAEKKAKAAAAQAQITIEGRAEPCDAQCRGGRAA